MCPASFQALKQFLGGWFHQDFDLDGDTLEEIVASYKAATSSGEVQLAKADIETFIEQSGDNIDRDFVDTFNPDVDPAGWGMTTREWLTRIHELL